MLGNLFGRKPKKAPAAKSTSSQPPQQVQIDPALNETPDPNKQAAQVPSVPTTQVQQAAQPVIPQSSDLNQPNPAPVEQIEQAQPQPQPQSEQSPPQPDVSQPEVQVQTPVQSEVQQQAEQTPQSTPPQATQPQSTQAPTQQVAVEQPVQPSTEIPNPPTVGEPTQTLESQVDQLDDRPEPLLGQVTSLPGTVVPSSFEFASGVSEAARSFQPQVVQIDQLYPDTYLSDSTEIRVQEPKQSFYRLLTLASLVARSQVESDLESRLGVGAKQEKMNLLQNLQDWVKGAKDQNIYQFMSPNEKYLMDKPGGTWSSTETTNAEWHTQGIVVLLWSLGLIDQIPLYDQYLEPAEILDIAGVMAPVSELLPQVKQRDDQMIQIARDIAEMWHWRTELEVLVRTDSLPPSQTPELVWQYVSEVSIRAFGRGHLPRPIGGDFPFVDKPLRLIDDDKLGYVYRASMDRHRTMNWLASSGVSWDNVAYEVELF